MIAPEHSSPSNTSGADQQGVPTYIALQPLILCNVPSDFKGKLTPKSQTLTISKSSVQIKTFALQTTS